MNDSWIFDHYDTQIAQTVVEVLPGGRSGPIYIRLISQHHAYCCFYNPRSEGISSQGIDIIIILHRGPPSKMVNKMWYMNITYSVRTETVYLVAWYGVHPLLR